MPNSLLSIWTSRSCFSIRLGLWLKTEGWGNIQGWGTGKSLPFQPSTVYVTQQRPHRNEAERLRKRILRMKRWIERTLNVHPGDLGRGTLLCSSLFLVISAYKIGGVAAAALFLSRFQARQLAYADISSSVLVAIVVGGYVVISRRVHLRNLVVGSMLFFASNCALFWALDHYYSRLLWLFPAFYIWVKILGVLVPTQIWTVANYVLTTREAKRVFGMVGGGGVAGWIFSGYFSKTVTRHFGTESLLVGMVFFVLICAGLVILIWRSGQAAVAGGNEIEEGTGQNSPRNLEQSMRLVFATPYLRA